MSDNQILIDANIKKIISQTNYDESIAREKLQEFNNDYMKVIKDYYGIETPKTTPIKSINQEIYKQFRSNLDQTTKSYREKNPVNLEHVITNFNESDERENDKKK